MKCSKFELDANDRVARFLISRAVVLTVKDAEIGADPEGRTIRSDKLFEPSAFISGLAAVRSGWQWLAASPAAPS